MVCVSGSIKFPTNLHLHIHTQFLSSRTTWFALIKVTLPSCESLKRASALLASVNSITEDTNDTVPRLPIPWPPAPPPPFELSGLYLGLPNKHQSACSSRMGGIMPRQAGDLPRVYSSTVHPTGSRPRPHPIPPHLSHCRSWTAGGGQGVSGGAG